MRLCTSDNAKGNHVLRAFKSRWGPSKGPRGLSSPPNVQHTGPRSDWVTKGSPALEGKGAGLLSSWVGVANLLGAIWMEPWGADPKTAGLHARGCLACRGFVCFSARFSGGGRCFPPVLRGGLRVSCGSQHGSLAGIGALLHAGQGAPQSSGAAMSAVAGCSSGCPLF